ncbi:MAG TPA: lysophospholipid acyltransferase family protein, partial [Bellilinea sp.]|nr:lysophospholipid acyltransferase family protein [Bellilinea sp.]
LIGVAVKRETLRNILIGAIKVLTRTTYEGLENLPADGGALVAFNHGSFLDSVVLFVNPKRTDLTGMVTRKYLKNPVIKWIVTTAGIIWLDRDSADFAAFTAGVKVLREGKVIGLSPEGTRSHSGELLQGKPGIVLLEQKTRVPVIPTGLVGMKDVFKKILTFQRPRVTVRFGKPLTFPPLSREHREAEMNAEIDEIMAQIAVLLPEDQRGYYRDHPRVKELTAR